MFFKIDTLNGEFLDLFDKLMVNSYKCNIINARKKKGTAPSTSELSPFCSKLPGKNVKFERKQNIVRFMAQSTETCKKTGKTIVVRKPEGIYKILFFIVGIVSLPGQILLRYRSFQIPWGRIHPLVNQREFSPAV